MASGRSIRFKISALLVIPLVSLVALWGFAAGTTSTQAMKLLEVESLWRNVVDNADRLVSALQRERLASAAHLAKSAEDPSALAASRADTDKARKIFAERSASEEAVEVLDAGMDAQLKETLSVLTGLAETRRRVDDGELKPTELVTAYTAISDSVHRLYASFAVGTDVDLIRQSHGLIGGDQVRELAHREHALLVAAAGDLSAADRVMLARIDGARAHQLPEALANLDDAMRSPFQRVDTTGFDQMIASYMGGAKTDIQIWKGVAEPVLQGYDIAVAQSGETLLSRMEPAGLAIVIRAVIAGVVGLVAVVFSVFISVRVARRLGRELADLRQNARDLAEKRLPELVVRLRRGERVDLVAEAPPVSVPPEATSEVVDLAAAYDRVQSTAIEAAIDQARLRQAGAEALRNLARRSQTLVQRQIKLLDEMQGQTHDPEALERLFRLDHLTTRMRRHSEGLVLLSGGAGGRRWRSNVPIEDTLNGAAAQVEDYTRIKVYPMPEIGVSGAAVADLMHLFAELMENGAAFSTPGSEVSVRGELVGRGYAVEIEDRGCGLSEAERRRVNERLAGPQEFDPSQTERLGFAVVGMLAARHGVSVTLKNSPYGGTSAVVLLPMALVEPLQPAVHEPPQLESVSVSVVRSADLTGAEMGPGGLPRRTRTSKRAHGRTPGRTQGRAQERLHERLPEPVLEPVLEPVPEPVPELMQDLPRRVRQTNLPQRLRQQQPERPGRLEERSPEETRALLSSLQSGWQRGRQDGDQNGGSES
ncbi:sensor histidine kinase [Nonomuraea longicatena]|uniref:histidine kinase n=1 Tax=Nonomuraea longicatena TaxID=83682 RepID=A0ABN1PY79_9ACTN